MSCRRSGELAEAEMCGVGWVQRRAWLYSARGYRRGAIQRANPWAAAPAPSVSGLVGLGRGRAEWVAAEGALLEHWREAKAVRGRRTLGSLEIGLVGPEPCDRDVTRGVRVHPELLPREIGIVGAEAQLGGVALPSCKHALLAEHLRRRHRQVGLPRAAVGEQREDKLWAILLVVVRRLRTGRDGARAWQVPGGDLRARRCAGSYMCAPAPLQVAIPPCRSRGRPTDYCGPGAASS